MAEIYLPSTLPPLFPGLPRKLELDAATVDEALGQLDAAWPGLRDRLPVMDCVEIEFRIAILRPVDAPIDHRRPSVGLSDRRDGRLAGSIDEGLLGSGKQAVLVARRHHQDQGRLVRQ